MRTVDNQVLTALHQIRDAIKNKECCCNKDEQGGGGNTPSDEIDYEAVYQFYKKKVIENIPEESLRKAIIPEHYTDIEDGNVDSPEYANKMGIWYSESEPIDGNILFCEINFKIDKYIYAGPHSKQHLG